MSAMKVSALDQFYVRGLAATAELAGLLGLSEGVRPLDAGSRLGGQSRNLAETFGCRVAGIDLCSNFVAPSRVLGRLSSSASRVNDEVGNINATPFAGECSDVVLTQHALMKVFDRACATANSGACSHQAGHWPSSM